MAVAAWAQAPVHYVDIHLGPGIRSENVFIRYILEGEELGGQVQARPGVTDYLISTMREDHAAAGFRALVYAPGCGMQTVNIALSGESNPQTDFVCRPLGEVTLNGRITQAERLSGHEVKVQARYLARWASAFLGIGRILVAVPLADAVEPRKDGRFQIAVPDLARDAVTGAPDHPGEIQIWAVDKVTGEDVAQLTTVEATNGTRMGGLKVQAEYPGETEFAPCRINGVPVLIDREGFAHRDFINPCDR